LLTSPIILTAQLGPSDQAWANALRNQYFPPERNFLNAHVTLFHHLPPAMLPEIKSVLSQIAKEYPPPVSRLTEVMNLGRGVAYRIDSPALMAIRDALAERFHGILIPQDQARPRLHITVQNKVEPHISKALFCELSAQFTPRSVTITGLSAFYYRGGPWEAIQTWPFRG
jgi:2'-5' RNA ligase superfamily